MKLQPNFSYQKYEADTEEKQFIYQMQREHIVVANAINATIDDCSYFTRERPTAFTWVNNKPIWTKTLPTSAWITAGTVNNIPIGIEGDYTIIEMTGCISNGNLASSISLILPHINITTPATSNISIFRNGDNLALRSAGDDRSAYSGYITIKFIKN